MPYHDGLFFFNIAFPPDYPSRPSMAHYRSFGYRINLNLYANWKEKKSAAYNEDAFLLSCRTMMLLIKRPPKYFKGFVMKHFRDQSSFILLACKAYKNGSAKIGYCNHQCESSSCVLEKFKKLMKQQYSELVVMFSRTGASLGNFVEQVNVGKKTAAPASESQARPKHKVGGVLGKLLKFLRLKKMVS
ncbi:hypothetical protein SLEP1_g15642 [Rubroshorea leprosula]|uniref:UBC core domain-containing protein n=1 Tax=Rubroshorea leprosula TaxID=152421 RepID=A0AAV5IXG5_9ROSI|nr:hypothetical protein SLEP1_g15642 [Rubroshorea leprosula]